jgi:hypothetical protein
MVLASNTIIERPLLHIINNVIILRYLVLKLPTHKRVAIMRENQGASRHCAFVYLKGKSFGFRQLRVFEGEGGG